MNVATATQTGLNAVISQLQKQKEELTVIYHQAITKGEKLHEVKTLYMSLKDVDKRLTELMNISISL
ncbi:MAG: hypothetical protein JO072_12020 [Parafilimonas sp.]|nr:hypothetical protein [Parafilimonas sp.]